MKFPDGTDLYLSGNAFSNSRMFSYEGDNCPEQFRIDLLRRLSRNKRVLHVGFADHLPLIQKKIAEGTWLHRNLIDVAEECAGIDIDQEAVEFCQSELKIDNIYCSDITADAAVAEVVSNTWDVAILGEIVEHLSNPVSFLSELTARYGSCCERLVITVPNAWEFGNFVRARKSVEFINTDHRFWFTPYTLAKIGVDAGLSPIEFFFVDGAEEQKVFLNAIRKRFPMYRDGLVMVFAFPK